MVSSSLGRLQRERCFVGSLVPLKASPSSLRPPLSPRPPVVGFLEDLRRFLPGVWADSRNLGRKKTGAGSDSPWYLCAMRKLFFSELTSCKETKLQSATHSWLPMDKGKLSKFTGHSSSSSSM